MPKKVFLTMIAVCLLLLSVSGSALAVTKSEVKASLADCSAYLSSVKSSAYSSYPDWVTLALYAGGQNVSALISQRSKDISSGALSGEDALTAYATALLSAAMSGDPQSFGGKDLALVIKKSQLTTGKFADSISGVGNSLLNAHIWGVISLYAAGGEIPNQSQALKWLTGKQNSDGGFSFDASSSSSDVDITGMTLIALKALGQDASSASVKKALAFLKSNQSSDGGFNSQWSGNNLESVATAVQALTAFDIDPASSGWTKGNNNLVSAMLAFQNSDGSFCHTKGGKADLMATYHAALALAAYSDGQTVYEKLYKKNYSFTDISSDYWAYAAIRKLFSAEVISGYADGSFKPKNPITRQEFAKMIVLARGKAAKIGPTTSWFTDVSVSSWANPYICLAVTENYLKGRAAKTFAPTAQITGAELMAVLVRALGYEEKAQLYKEDTWYSGYIKIADSLDLLYPGFAAEAAATRSQTAYSLAKVLIE